MLKLDSRGVWCIPEDQIFESRVQVWRKQLLLVITVDFDLVDVPVSALEATQLPHDKFLDVIWEPLENGSLENVFHVVYDIHLLH